MQPKDTVLEYLTEILANWDKIYLNKGGKYWSLAQCADQREILKFLRGRLRELDKFYEMREADRDPS